MSHYDNEREAMQTNHIHKSRRKRGQVDYETWELKVLLAVDGKGVTAEQLTHVLRLRNAGSISRKASDQGVSLGVIR